MKKLLSVIVLGAVLVTGNAYAEVGTCRDQQTLKTIELIGKIEYLSNAYYLQLTRNALEGIGIENMMAQVLSDTMTMKQRHTEFGEHFEAWQNGELDEAKALAMEQVLKRADEQNLSLSFVRKVNDDPSHDICKGSIGNYAVLFERGMDGNLNYKIGLAK